MAAPAFVAGQEDRAVATLTSHDVNIVSHSDGDILVLAFAQTTQSSSPATPTNTPSGWAVVEDVEAGASSAVRITVFIKVGDGVEAQVTITTDVASRFSSYCAAYSGGSVTPDVSGQAEQESGVDMTAPAVTTTVVDTRVIFCFVFDDNVSTEADVDSDAGFQGTLRAYDEHSVPGNGLAFAYSDITKASAADTGTCVFSTNGDTDAGCAITLALAPSAAVVGLAPYHPIAPFRHNLTR